MVELDGSEPEERFIGEDGREYEKTDHIPIDFDSVPQHVREELAKATLEMVWDILQQPGGREMLAAKTAARKNRQS